jgi:hypothetical protein
MVLLIQSVKLGGIYEIVYANIKCKFILLIS